MNRRQEAKQTGGLKPTCVALAVCGLLGGLTITQAAASEPAGSLEDIVKFIDAEISQAWADNEIEPSPPADDAEWLRRVYLDIVGHIPPADAVEDFLASRDSDKRAQVVERLLDDPGYVRRWTTVWSNLLVGRQTPDRVNRPALEKFLREAFTRNRPWHEVVHDLVSAEGHFEENGAVNYLLAQMAMNDEGVQATARTAQLFLGLQVQCTQCHNHPFNDWKQNQFWEFNSFFRQARRIDHRRYDPQSGRMVDDYSELVRGNYGGPVYFERRSGLMQVAFPEYLGEKVDPSPETDRRQELAKLIVAGEETLVAQAHVNRMWGLFFGYGFTRPVDDMGPHNPPTHPELLDRLTVEFVRHGYDQKQLIRWIAHSRAYGLTSRFGSNNKIDDPASGEAPLFSHMYVKALEAEQLFDSLIVATGAHRASRSAWSEAEQQRQRWLQQFVIAFGTDENDEATTFNGTIPQALMMMNGELIENAISLAPGSFLNGVLAERGGDPPKVRKLYLAALGREPSRRELAAAQQFFRGRSDKPAAYQDLFWALLNSNEFIFNH
jgi:hypothetical protein